MDMLSLIKKNCKSTFIVFYKQSCSIFPFVCLSVRNAIFLFIILIIIGHFWIYIEQSEQLLFFYDFHIYLVFCSVFKHFGGNKIKIKFPVCGIFVFADEKTSSFFLIFNIFLIFPAANKDKLLIFLLTSHFPKSTTYFVWKSMIHARKNIKILFNSLCPFSQSIFFLKLRYLLFIWMQIWNYKSLSVWIMQI